MIVEKFEFPNAEGHDLAAVLDLPDGKPRAFALFAHCFTCGKDVLAARRIAATLTEHGLGVVRFDFTGLGASEGEFANSNFSSNVSDLTAAADAMRARGMAPSLLIGHSLGGAAVLVVAEHVPEAKAVVTIAAPFDPSHVTHLFADQLDELAAGQDVDVTLGGRAFRLTQQFVSDVAQHRLEACLADLKKALLVFHSPQDEVVGIDNASHIFKHAKHPKSFISLHGADHMLSRASDAAYIANVIAAGVDRYLVPLPKEEAPEPENDQTVVVAETGFGKFQQVASVSGHRIYADEPVTVGGLGTGGTPYDLVLAGLGACTSMTLRLYADSKGWPLRRAEVRLQHDRVHREDCANPEAPAAKLDRLRRTLVLDGDLDEAQRQRLLEIADKCPVHRTLTEGAHVTTRLAPPVA